MYTDQFYKSLSQPRMAHLNHWSKDGDSRILSLKISFQVEQLLWSLEVQNVIQAICKTSMVSQNPKVIISTEDTPI